ncbi:hypothetical protein LTR10_020741 [Elasticomyces elasticus]|uniref:Ubiquitin-like domain-containing protein n=1 Tax=Exophiala sideris TaxID=1016849 RepID=A0ABR0JN27_9EURO|nr:hypothetical protein LTR10_020741 [Elasticomyces elasticus]KAK5036668.1 hypothetical protein LTS07_002396 [Exophiala sideris]KAK5067052.1 hypothetical protein LTR69_002401 [Exophiala sideris]KAK5185110.1 hypothetical protein LTR44_002957 [Eurotiomycetes sp. CCFEE 6388]
MFIIKGQSPSDDFHEMTIEAGKHYPLADLVQGWANAVRQVLPHHDKMEYEYSLQRKEAGHMRVGRADHPDMSQSLHELGLRKDDVVEILPITENHHKARTGDSDYTPALEGDGQIGEDEPASRPVTRSMTRSRGGWR